MGRRENIRSRELELASAAGKEWQLRSDEILARELIIRDKGPSGADSAARVGKFLAREAQRSRADPSMLGIERRFGPTLDYEYIGPVESQSVSKSVARLVEMTPDGGAMSGFATGFMVSPQLLLTNWHVFEDAASAEGT